VLGEGGVRVGRDLGGQGGSPIRRDGGRAAGSGPVSQRIAPASSRQPAFEGPQVDAEGASDLGPRHAGVHGGDGPLTEVGGNAGSHDRECPTPTQLLLRALGVAHLQPKKNGPVKNEPGGR